jgi:hypothetical protein
MIRFIISIIVSILIAATAYHFIFQKDGGGLYGQNPTRSVQNAKDAVQQDTNYTNQVKSTIQNQYSQ